MNTSSMTKTCQSPQSPVYLDESDSQRLIGIVEKNIEQDSNVPQLDIVYIPISTAILQRNQEVYACEDHQEISQIYPLIDSSSSSQLSISKTSILIAKTTALAKVMIECLKGIFDSR